MKKILVATDFSTAGQNALQYAIEYAKSTKAEIILYHVFTLPALPVTEVPWSVLPSSTELKKENLMTLQNALDTASGISFIQAKTFTEAGTPVDKIIEFAEKEKANIIVMGMKHGSTLKEYFIGSVATRVLKRSGVPVLLVPEGYKFKKPEKVVFACDYDIKNMVILNPLKKLIYLFDAQLMVLHIKEHLEPADTDQTITVNKLEVALKNTVRSFHFMEDTNLVRGLKKFVDEQQADMVITIAHKHNFIESVFRSDHNKKIAFHLSVPIFSIPDNHKDVAAYFV